MSTEATTPAFQLGKVYVIGVTPNTDNRPDKRLLLYNGPEKPWRDICSGESAVFDQDVVTEIVEVPPVVVEAIKLAQDKRPLPAAVPVNEYEPEAWEQDVYWDDEL
jgi:hypothetical protein